MNTHGKYKYYTKFKIIIWWWNAKCCAKILCKNSKKNHATILKPFMQIAEMRTDDGADQAKERIWQKRRHLAIFFLVGCQENIENAPTQDKIFQRRWFHLCTLILRIQTVLPHSNQSYKILKQQLLNVRVVIRTLRRCWNTFNDVRAFSGLWTWTTSSVQEILI